MELIKAILVFNLNKVINNENINYLPIKLIGQSYYLKIIYYLTSKHMVLLEQNPIQEFIPNNVTKITLKNML